jgi:hypothetical protein
MYPNSKIAAGYNNTGGLAAWESLTPSGDIPFIAPVVFGSFLFGQEHTNTDGTFFYGGYSSSKPLFGYVTQRQGFYIYNTILSGNWSGPVTAEMRTVDPDTYNIYNCILKVEQYQSQTKKGRAFEGFKLSYTRLVFIS